MVESNKMKKYNIQDFLEVKSSGSGSFSHDSTKISYISNLSGTSQIYLTSIKGGEAQQITAYEDSVSFAVFSPTKDEIIFGKSAGGNEQTQFYLYSLETKETKGLTERPDVRHDYGGFSYDGKYIAYSSTERNGKDKDIYIMNLETGETECVYDKGGACNSIGFSPKGTFLVIQRNNSNFDQDIFLFNLITKELEHINPHEGDIFFELAKWLPDESAFFFITNKDRDFIGLSKYSLATKTFDYVLTPDWDVDGASISRNGKYIATIINEGGYEKMNVRDTNDLTKIYPFDLPSGMIYSGYFSVDSKYLMLTIGSSLKNSDVWVYSVEENKYWQITESPQGVPSEELVEPKLIKYTSFDGLEVPAFVYLPKSIQEGTKLPVIVNIHGGPEGQFTPSLALLVQYFVYSGYAVIGPNVRGSTGYGKKYLAMDDIEKRLDSVKDLEYLHKYIQTTPELDSNKVVLMGGSYGGYMTLAGLAFYPDLWAGGVDIVGIANFITFLENTAPYRRAIREAEYGFLDKHRDLLYAISPINHIDKIKAPLFIIHGANDPRVPLSEAQQIVDKLKELGRETELLVYHDEGHGLAKLKNRLDAYPKVVKFLDRIVGKSK